MIGKTHLKLLVVLALLMLVLAAWILVSSSPSPDLGAPRLKMEEEVSLRPRESSIRPGLRVLESVAYSTPQLMVKVLSFSGNSVAGARVTICGPNGARHIAESDDDGEVVFAETEIGAWSIQVDHPCERFQKEELDLGLSGANVEMRALEWGRVRVRVADKFGAPVENAIVEVIGPIFAEGLVEPLSSTTEVTGPDGFCEVDRLHPSLSYSVSASHANGVAYPVKPILLTPNGPEVAFTLLPLYGAKIRFVHKETGRVMNPPRTIPAHSTILWPSAGVTWKTLRGYLDHVPGGAGVFMPEGKEWRSLIGFVNIPISSAEERVTARLRTSELGYQDVEQPIDMYRLAEIGRSPVQDVLMSLAADQVMARFKVLEGANDEPLLKRTTLWWMSDHGRAMMEKDKLLVGNHMIATPLSFGADGWSWPVPIHPGVYRPANYKYLFAPDAIIEVQQTDSHQFEIQSFVIRRIQAARIKAEAFSSTGHRLLCGWGITCVEGLKTPISYYSRPYVLPGRDGYAVVDQLPPGEYRVTATLGGQRAVGLALAQQGDDLPILQLRFKN